MKIFLDTNIILDLLLEREGYEDSAVLFEMQDTGRLNLCVSLLTMVNVAFVYKKTVGPHLAAANIKYLSSLVEVLPMNGEQLQQALLLEGRDIEDILQAACAAEAGCDYLITRNVKDYRIGKGLAKGVALPPLLSPSAILDVLR